MIVNKVINNLKNRTLYAAINRKANSIKTKRYHSKIGNLAPYTNEVIEIDPTKICGHMDVEAARSFRNLTGYVSGVVVHKNWDKANEIRYLDIKETGFYKSCKLRWINGYEWEETNHFQFYVECLQKKTPCRFNTFKELANRFKKLDQIFKDVNSTRKMSKNYVDLVIISVASNGRLIWGPDGKHRVCIALLADLKTMPARVGFIHSNALHDFQSLRKNNHI